MKLLITHGADLNFKNYVEKDSRFQGHGLLFQVFRMNFDFFFFQKTTKIKVTNIFFWLLQAISFKEFEMCEFLVKKGIEIKYTDRYGKTLLHYAVQGSDYKIGKKDASKNYILTKIW